MSIPDAGQDSISDIPRDRNSPFRDTGVTCGLAVALIGLLGLAGLWFGIPLLTSVLPGLKPIAISACLAWIVLGLVLAICAYRLPEGRIWLAVSALVLLIIVLSAMEIPMNIMGGHIFVETLLIRSGDAVFATSLTPISPLAAILLFISALGLFVILVSSRYQEQKVQLRNVAGILGTVVALSSFTILLSYVHGKPFLYGTVLIPIAVTSALAGLIMGAGLVITAGQGSIPISYITGPSIRARLLRIFLPLVILVIFVQDFISLLVPEIYGAQNTILVSLLLVGFTIIASYLIAKMSGIFSRQLENEQEGRLQAEKDERETREYLENLIHYANAPIITWNPEYRITEFNHAFETLTGLSRKDVIGQFLHILFPEETCKSSMERIRSTSSGEQWKIVEIPIRQIGGTTRTVLWNSANVTSPDGVLIATIAQGIDITERKQAEEAREESEIRFRSVFENSMVGMVLVRPDFRFQAANAMFCAMLGYNEEELKTKTFAEITHPDHIATDIAQVNRLKTGDIAVYKTEKRYIRKDGTVFWASITISTLRDKAGKLTNLLGFIDDITDKKQADEALRKGEERFRTMIDWTYDWEYWISPDSEIIYMSPSVLRITGHSPDEFTVDRTLIDRIVHPDDRTLWEEHRAEHGKAEGSDSHNQIEFRIIRKDGSLRWIGHICRSIYIKDGTWSGIRVSNRDITDRKNAEEARRETNEYLSNLLDYANAPMIVWDPTFRITRFNHAFEHLTGRFEQDVIGQHLEILFPETSRDASLNLIQKTLAGERWEIVEIPILHVSGEIRIALWNSANIVNPQGTIISTIAQGYDITDRKMAEDALRQNEEKYRVLFNRMTEGSALHEMVYDAAGNPADYRILDVNPAFESILGIRRDEVIGKTSREAYGVDTPPYFEVYSRVAETRVPEKFEVYFEPMKKYFTISVYSTRKGRFATMFEDITSRKRAEVLQEQLIRELEQKNAELERFTYTVSHDLKSPLITIKGFTGLLEDDIRKGDQARLKKDLHRIMTAADTMQELLSDLLELSRIGRVVSPPEKVSFGTIAHEAVDLLAGSLAERSIEVEIADGLPEVSVDHARIREVLVNLLENSIKFSAGQPDPVIRIGVDTSGAEPVFFVQDNGIGIDPRYLERIFKLFERLDVSTHGTGIGLPIARRIIEVHGGKIWAESEGPMKGTTIRFTLHGALTGSTDNNNNP
ncbi:MAG: PAS domain S-box protein [Methanoregula sp.]